MSVTESCAISASTEENRLPESQLQRLFDRITEISSLPHVAAQVISLVNDPKTVVDDLVEVVRLDPALAMRLMRTVNSSYYGLREKVSDLKQATSLLGFEEIRNLALTAYVAPLFRETADWGTYTRRGLWNHMIGTAMIAQVIARDCGNLSRHEAYLAGLLHDLGIILIDQYLHDHFCRILDTLSAETAICDVEVNVLGFDHAALGGYVVSRWNLPEHLGATIASHHSPDQYDGPLRRIVYAVALADYLCNRKGLTPLGAGRQESLPAEAIREFDLTTERTAAIVGCLDDILMQANLLADAQLRYSL